MDTELRKRLEEAAENTLNGLNNNCYIHIDENTEDAYKDGFRDGAEYGYKEAIAQAKEWLIEHIGCDVECNENGEPLADSYIKGRKLAIEIVENFEADMNKLWEEQK